MTELDPIIKALAARQRSIDAALSPSLAGLAKVMGQFGADLERSMSAIQETLARAIAAFANAETRDKQTREYAAAMLALGWPPVTDLYLPNIREIVSRFPTEDPEMFAAEVSDFLVRFYSPEELEQKLDSWRRLRWVDGRIAILEKVIKAHCAGDFELSIPALLPQIEGVVASGFAYSGRLNGQQLTALLDRLLAAEGDLTDAAYRQYIDTVLLVGFEHGAPLGSGLSRHAILHGADTHYATVDNSLRTILLFDYLASSFRIVSLEGSMVAHMPGCAHVARSGRPRSVFKSWRSAKAHGKIACKTCEPDRNLYL